MVLVASPTRRALLRTSLLIHVLLPLRVLRVLRDAQLATLMLPALGAEASLTLPHLTLMRALEKRMVLPTMGLC